MLDFAVRDKNYRYDTFVQDLNSFNVYIGIRAHVFCLNIISQLF